MCAFFIFLLTRSNYCVSGLMNEFLCQSELLQERMPQSDLGRVKLDTYKNDFAGETRSLLILGAGGLGQVVAEMAQMSGCYSMIAFLDDNPNEEKEALYHIVGRVREAEGLAKSFTHVIPALGNNQTRYKLIEKMRDAGFQIPRLIHPSAVISPTAKIGDGCIIRERVVISRNVVIGDGCLINIGAMIDHKCVVGNGSHIPMGSIVRNEITIPEMSNFAVGQIVE